MTYTPGDRVHYLGQIWECKEGGAYGADQVPPTPPATENDYWRMVTQRVMDDVKDPTSRAVGTWMGFRKTVDQSAKVNTAFTDGVWSIIESDPDYNYGSPVVGAGYVSTAGVSAILAPADGGIKLVVLRSTDSFTVPAGHRLMFRVALINDSGTTPSLVDRWVLRTNGTEWHTGYIELDLDDSVVEDITGVPLGVDDVVSYYQVWTTDVVPTSFATMDIGLRNPWASNAPDNVKFVIFDQYHTNLPGEEMWSDPDLDPYGTRRYRKTELDLVNGISSPQDQTTGASNALEVRNLQAWTQDYSIWGVTNPWGDPTYGPLPESVVEQAVPLPRITAWNRETRYRAGQYASRYGQAYRALRDSLGLEPDRYDRAWVKVSYDDRVPVVVAFEAHAGFDGEASVALDPALEFYDEHGNFLARMQTSVPDPVPPGVVGHGDWTVADFQHPFVDTFNDPMRDVASWNERTGDIVPDGYTWSQPFGKWRAVRQDDGYVAAPVSMLLNMAISLRPMGWITGKYDYYISVTLGTPPLSSTSRQALVFGYGDEDNHYAVTTDGVRWRQAGVTTNLYDFPAGENPGQGDRITVFLHGDPTIIEADPDDPPSVHVYVNGVLKTEFETSAGLSGQCGMAIMPGALYGD